MRPSDSRRRSWLGHCAALAAGLSPWLSKAAAQNSPSTAPPLAAQAAVPVEVRQALGEASSLRGRARLRMLGFLIYDASLWVGERFNPERFWAEPFALELLYGRSLKGSSIAERSLDEMRRGGLLEAATAQAWLSFMSQVFPDVQQGDRITGTWDARQERAAFFVNGSATQALQDAEFGRRFFARRFLRPGHAHVGIAH